MSGFEPTTVSRHPLPLNHINLPYWLLMNYNICHLLIPIVFLVHFEKKKIVSIFIVHKFLCFWGHISSAKILSVWTVILAQLVEQLVSTPEVRGSNQVIGKICFEHLFTVNWIEKTKIKKKKPWIAHLKHTDCRRKFLLKKWANLGVFLFIFHFFTFQTKWQIYNLNNINW